MTKDIVPELLEKLENEFVNKYSKNKKINSAVKKIKIGKATHKDSNEFAYECGKILAEVFKENISPEDLPDGKMYYNIADRVLNDTLGRNYKLISDYSADVQTSLNKSAGLRIKGLKPPKNQDRINGLIEKVQEKTYEETKWVLQEPIINFSQSIIDDTIRTNVDFHNKLGLKPKIVRKMNGNCCDWCKEVEGEYKYPNVPKDVFRRHRFCRCTVEYFPGNGRKQNVHTKKWQDVDADEKIERRIKHSEGNEILTKNKKTLRTTIGFDLVDDSIDNVDSVLLDKNVKQLGKLENKFRAIHKSFGSISSESSGNAVAYVSRTLKDPSKQNLVLNIKYFSQEKKLTKEIEESIKHNWSMPAKIENYSLYTVTHEYGHILQNSIMAEELNEIGGFENFKTKATTTQGKINSYKKLQENIQKRHFEEIREIAAQKSNEPNNVIANNLSIYGKTNYAEFFAEAFANSQLGEPNELGNAMNDWLKKKGL